MVGLKDTTKDNSNGESTLSENIKQNIDRIYRTSILNTLKLYNNNNTPTNTTNNKTPLINDENSGEDDSKRIKLYSKIKDEYEPVKDLPMVAPSQKKPSAKPSTSSIEIKPTIEEMEVDKSIDNIIKSLPKQDEKRRRINDDDKSSQITIYNKPNTDNINNGNRALINQYEPLTYTKPEWHPPWKLMRVISGHTGWVRAIAVDKSNEWFATGSTDNTIKVWDLASGELKVTLTGHVSAIRGLEVSSRHPYLFSVGEDNKVLCWDLEANKQVRNYYGHSKGVYSVALHPTLDVLFSGGRDSSVRVWDMRTRANIFEMKGHKGTVVTLKSQSADPQVISGSMDTTVKLWDLATGTSAATLTNHKKGVRSMVIHEKEYSFATGASDNIKQWKCPDGSFIKNLSGHTAIINSLALNADNVLASGGDNGSISFWDWKTGHCFQKTQTIVQPGSLEGEAGIFDMAFDKTGSRLITCEADKTIKFYKEDEDATPYTHPVVNWKPTNNDRY
ncbi:hypothetical protein RB653_004153 [Dictyostelium firmibasis]|uniref:WD40 repeat-like protein n=1 Tax=Dictyostelium firmibasis TaxID=79012 RepID=A0AAN7U991_9MYCE